MARLGLGYGRASNAAVHAFERDLDEHRAAGVRALHLALGGDIAQAHEAIETALAKAYRALRWELKGCNSSAIATMVQIGINRARILVHAGLVTDAVHWLGDLEWQYSDLGERSKYDPRGRMAAAFEELTAYRDSLTVRCQAGPESSRIGHGNGLEFRPVAGEGVGSRAGVATVPSIDGQGGNS